VHSCKRCGGSVGDAFRFCPWCAAPQRLKLVEFFRGHPEIELQDRALRVSRYLEDEPVERHTRFSIWSASETKARAEAAVSLDEAETARLTPRLTRFLLDTEAAERPTRGLRRVLDQFRG
jgi:hypothetical protein